MSSSSASYKGAPSSHLHNIALEFNPRDFRHLSVANESLASVDSQGEDTVIARLERFGLSCNNLASALAPGLDCSWPELFDGMAGRSRIPVWGYAEVVQSNRAGYEPGMGFFGYFPMSRFVLINSDSQTQGDFGFENTFQTGRTVPIAANSQNTQDIDYQILLRPLLSAGYLMLQELYESQFWQTRQVIVTCASSKTALALALFLQDFYLREGLSHAPQVVGLTGERHLSFVQQHGHYDQVFSYEQFRQLDNVDSVLVDFSGNSRIRSLLHYYLKQRLIHSYGLGACHWQDQPTGIQTLPEPEYFSAINFYRQRAKKAQYLNQQFQECWKSTCESYSSWLQSHFVEGVDEVRWVYEQLLAGKASPASGYLCQL